MVVTGCPPPRKWLVTNLRHDRQLPTKKTHLKDLVFFWQNNVNLFWKPSSHLQPSHPSISGIYIREKFTISFIRSINSKASLFLCFPQANVHLTRWVWWPEQAFSSLYEKKGFQMHGSENIGLFASSLNCYTTNKKKTHVVIEGIIIFESFFCEIALQLKGGVLR